MQFLVFPGLSQDVFGSVPELFDLLSHKAQLSRRLPCQNSVGAAACLGQLNQFQTRNQTADRIGRKIVRLANIFTFIFCSHTHIIRPTRTRLKGINTIVVIVMPMRQNSRSF
jgi:hypothetical protein